MTALVWLIPCALVLGFVGLVAFLWAMNSGQFQDLEGAGWRAIQDDDDRPSTEPDKPSLPIS
jgi:cbb3-type cytochrome oxidase maturation protein